MPERQEVVAGEYHNSKHSVQSIVHTGLAERMSGVLGKFGHDDITESVKNTSMQVIVHSYIQ